MFLGIAHRFKLNNPQSFGDRFAPINAVWFLVHDDGKYQIYRSCLLQYTFFRILLILINPSVKSTQQHLEKIACIISTIIFNFHRIPLARKLTEVAENVKAQLP
jgi:hypothetical protein